VFEPPAGLFVAEGELVLRRAVRAGYRLRSVLLDPRRVAQLADLLAVLPAEVPVWTAGPAVLEAVTGFAVHRGVLASVHRRPLLDAADLLGRARRLVVLEDVNTHTNVGAVFRCAAGLGMDAVLLSPTCADPLYRRSVRVSMGEVFAVPYARLEPWPEALERVRAAGLRLLALTPAAGAVDLRTLAPEDRRRAAVLLGAEGAGLSAGAVAAADLAVRIPMRAGVDSLNVAAAAAVTFWELTQDD